MLMAQRINRTVEAQWLPPSGCPTPLGVGKWERPTQYGTEIVFWLLSFDQSCSCRPTIPPTTPTYTLTLQRMHPPTPSCSGHFPPETPIPGISQVH